VADIYGNNADQLNDYALQGTGNPDNIFGYGGRDELFGKGGRDHLFGGENTDFLFGGAANDYIQGDEGDDYIDGGAGADKIFGGSGFDRAFYTDSGAAVTVNLATGAASGGQATGDEFSSIEGVSGSEFSDTVSGNAGTNSLFGYGGHDSLFGGASSDYIEGMAGNDTVSGGSGADTMHGGSGIDTLVYTAGLGETGIYIDLLTNDAVFGQAEGDFVTGFENVVGTARSDTYLGGNHGVNRLDGGAGNDLVNGRDGGDSMIGGSGFDQLSYLGSDEGVTINLATGAASGGYADGDSFTGFEAVNGSHKNDDLYGDAGANRLYGEGGVDELYGGGGGDLLNGGGQLDFMWGGGGADTFEFRFLSDSSTGAVRDQVRDFSSGQGDRFDLDYIDAQAGVLGKQDFTFIDTAAFSGTGQVRYYHSGGNTIVQLNTEGDASAEMEFQVNGLQDLNAGYFLF
jgi:Ca2+-binding RTX toxin-like protein